MDLICTLTLTAMPNQKMSLTTKMVMKMLIKIEEEEEAGQWTMAYFLACQDSWYQELRYILKYLP